MLPPQTPVTFTSVMKLHTLLAFTALGLGAALAPALRAADTAREIAITANDAMQFNLKEITAAPGEKLNIKFSHIGKLPKAAMGHNWVLLSAASDSDVQKLAMECMKNAPDYLPKDRSVILAHTKLLGGGESDVITFTAPDKPGAYPYLCTFPGHFSMMKGKLIVK
jgi:azurin